jgi:multidrug efflux pump subunit AcrB
MKSIVTAFARNTVFANIVIALLFIAGGLASFGLIRETFPEFSLDMIIIQVPWPGADPEEVEEGISRKIEEAIAGLDGIRQYNTMSGENMAIAQIEVAKGFELDYVKERVRNAIDAISTFPMDAEKPVTEELLFRQEVVLLALHGDGLTEVDLKEWAERIKDEVRELPEVSQVEVIGGRDYEISIEVSEERLREYGLSFDDVSRIVRANCLNASGGVMRTQGEEIRLRTLGRRYTAKEFAEIVALTRPNGETIPLKRLADIRDGFEDDNIISRFNGVPCINVMVLKTPDEDTLSIDESVRAYVSDKRKVLPEGLEISVWGGTSDLLEARIFLLVRNGLIGLCLVFVMLWLFLDIRLSFWAGMGMPISIAGALGIMWCIGASLNMISLFSLIMVLGIIVDDAIVVGEAIYVARSRGVSGLRAAVEGVMEVGLPVIAAVTTTVVAFIPLAFVGGVMGKFIKILPVVVVCCLAISLVECLILLPAHLSHMPKPDRRITGRHPVRRWGQRLHAFTNGGLEWFIAQVYEPFMDGALRRPYIAVAVAVAVLLTTQGLLSSGYIKYSTFPKLDGNRLTAIVEFPNGTPLPVTQAAVARLEAAIQKVDGERDTLNGDPIIKNMFSLVGSTIDDFKPLRGSHYGAVRLEMPDASLRGHTSAELMVAWEQEVGAIPGVISLSIAGDESGPPGAPIEVWLQAHDMEKLMAAAQDLKEHLATYAGVYQIQDDFRPGKNELKLTLKPEARALGLNVADLARQVYAGYFGEEAIRLQRGRDDVRVRVRYPDRDRKSVTDFERIRVRTRMGQEVPLLSVADVRYGPGYATINRTDGMRRVAVTAEVDVAVANANEIQDALDKHYFPGMLEDFHDVSVSLQGEKKKTAESLGSMTFTYPLALLGIFIIIATIFRSYIQPLVIMITVPFGIIGAILGHMLLGYELSIMSFFGMVALSGVVVNDAIVLIDSVNRFLSQGLPFFTAVRKGGARRFRAIFLTSVSTVGGLTPLMLEQDMQAIFLIPMAISMAAGVAFATLLTLILVPCLLVALSDFRRAFHWFRFGQWPTREAVEPASNRGRELREAEGMLVLEAAEGGAS